VTLVGTIVTSLATVLVHSAFSGWMHAISLLLLAGMLSVLDLRSLFSALGTGVVNAVAAPLIFLRGLKQIRLGKMAIGALLWRSRIYLVPIIILVVFIAIYRNASPVFDGVIRNTFGWFGDLVVELFSHFNFALAGTFLLCLMVAALLLVRNEVSLFAESDRASLDQLFRKRKRRYKVGLSRSLMHEYRAAMFLLFLLNLAILVLNVTDIQWVWLNFEWEGQYLKQFVHEGTWLLILSIVISIVLVLYHFRGNLNFLTRNKTLKVLSYVWLMQNAVLAVSVAIRNFYYISYFSLAYKRIGVLIFLVLVLCGLITVVIKVMKQRTGFYLFRINALAWFIVLVVASSVPWDVIIARHNIGHADRSFLHLNYLSSLSDKALPYLDVPLDELNALHQKQLEMFPFSKKEQYMVPEVYHQMITDRKEAFMKRYESEGFLSRNLPEYLAYQRLKAKGL
jgi:hypothetical protein